MSFDYHAVSGDYQYKALESGHPVQRFWHGGKLIMLDYLVQPHLAKGACLLEIGCGSGNLLLHASLPGTLPVALDLSYGALAFVRSRMLAARQETGHPERFLLTQGIGESLPFQSGMIDLVLLSEVIEHLEMPEHVIREAVRVLRPGGYLLVTTPNYRSLWPLLEWLVDHLNLTPKMAGEQHISRFHIRSLKDMLEQSGLLPEFSSSIYLFSPFASLLSQSLAQRILKRELKSGSRTGMILVALARKP